MSTARTHQRNVGRGSHRPRPAAPAPEAPVSAETFGVVSGVVEPSDAATTSPEPEPAPEPEPVVEEEASEELKPRKKRASKKIAASSDDE